MIAGIRSLRTLAVGVTALKMIEQINCEIVFVFMLKGRAPGRSRANAHPADLLLPLKSWRLIPLWKDSGEPNLHKDADHNQRQTAPNQQHFLSANVTHGRKIVVHVRVAIEKLVALVINQETNSGHKKHGYGRDYPQSWNTG